MIAVMNMHKSTCLVLDKSVSLRCSISLILPCRTQHIHREWNNCQIWNNGWSTSAWGEHSY